MMRKLGATVRKELLLLFRDREGILVLFLMPMALIIVMALIQDAPFKDYQEKRIPLLYVDKDGGPLGNTLGETLDSTTAFEVQHPFEGKAPDRAKVEQAVREGAYKVAILLPEDASERSEELASQKGEELLGAEPDSSDERDTARVPIHLYFDPVAKPAFKTSVRNFVSRFAADQGAGKLLGAMGETLKKLFPEAELKKVGQQRERLFRVKEERVGEDKSLPELSSVQHNVPAWTVFGIFFIVVTMAGNMIRERNDGSAFRMKTLPYSTFPNIGGKVGAYLLVSLVQCVLMLLVGVLLLPLFGLAAFKTGNDFLGIAGAALATGFAATGFGVFVGSVFSTQQQATGFSAVAIVLLAAIGGVWVPLYVMPDGMQSLGRWSPLHWGLDAFNAIFIRASGITGTLPDLGKLFFAGVLMMGGAQIIEKRRSY